MMIADSANAKRWLRWRFERLEFDSARVWLASGAETAGGAKTADLWSANCAETGIAQNRQCSSAVTRIRTAAAVQAAVFAASSSSPNALDN